MSDKIETTNSILKQTYAIDVTKNEIKRRNELIADNVEGRQSWLDLESAKAEVARLKEVLNQELANDADYNNQLEDLGQLKDKLKDQKDTLSSLIVAYYFDTHENQLPPEKNGDTREIVIAGKLGKKVKYQTNLFASKR